MAIAKKKYGRASMTTLGEFWAAYMRRSSTMLVVLMANPPIRLFSSRVAGRQSQLVQGTSEGEFKARRPYALRAHSPICNPFTRRLSIATCSFFDSVSAVVAANSSAGRTSSVFCRWRFGRCGVRGAFSTFISSMNEAATFPA